MYKYIKKSLLLFVCFSLLFLNNVLAQNKIYRLGSNSLSDKLQIVMNLDRVPHFKAFSLSKPLRIVVDVRAQAAITYQNDLNFKRRGVRSVRTTMKDNDTVRLVLELQHNYRWKAYALPGNKQKNRPSRLVVDIYDGKSVGRVVAKKPSAIVLESASQTSKPKPKPKVKPKSLPKVELIADKPSTQPAIAKTTPKSAKPVKNKSTQAKPIQAKPIAKISPRPQPSPRHRQIIVVIDAGHGGKDSGAVGKYGTKEKHVVLQIAKRLKRKVDAISGMKAILTRSSDRYISLRGRLRLARKYKADLFVSIHADAARNRSAQGASVYILSNRGASSESARWLARRENAVDLKYGVDIGDYDKDVSNMIMQIQQDATIESSHLLAKKTLRKMKGIGKLHKRFVERAGFAVLKSPDIPSMLVETAFISNPEEEERLQSEHYQNEIAASIAGGIQAYFADHMPQQLLIR